MTYNHTFHLVNYSPWPLTGALGVLTLLSGTLKMFNDSSLLLMSIGLLIVLLTMYTWWRDITRESTFQGFHTNQVMQGLKWGMILFITSEIFFFISFFWSFFHSSLSPTLELGLIWPPTFIQFFDPFKIPLLNTIILITSGISITWSHHALMNKSHIQTKTSLIITIILGIYFTLLQLLEYLESPFNITDSIYGSSFFMATGFHGLHVMIGTLFLMTCLMRLYKNHFSSNHHFGFEAAAWYWHFVDVVWLFLYISIYWWGS